MTILRQITKEKSQQVWDETHNYQYCENVPLYDSLPKTMNRIARQGRKALKEEIDGDKIDKLYYIGNQGLFSLETDLKMVLWDIHEKVNHRPTKAKIKEKIDFLSGCDHNHDVEDYFYREHHSMLEDLANGHCGYHYEETDIEYYYDKVIDNKQLEAMNNASEEDIVNFCIKEYRRAIKLIQKCLDENEIKCEIIGDCYLDN